MAKNKKVKIKKSFLLTLLLIFFITPSTHVLGFQEKPKQDILSPESLFYSSREAPLRDFTELWREKNIFGGLIYSKPPESLPNIAAVDHRINIKSFNSYIIKFDSPSLAEKYKDLKTLRGEIRDLEKSLKETSSPKEISSLKNQIAERQQEIRSELAQHQSRLIREQEEALRNIKALVPQVKIRKVFSHSFNGASLSLSPAEAKIIEESGYQIWANQEVKAFLIDSIPLINADDVWQLKDSNNNSITGQGIKIAIIDTGVDYTHSDLGGCFGRGCKVESGYDFVNNDSDPMDDMGHGTHVAAIAAGKGVLKGVAPDATIYAYKVLNQYGRGTWELVIEGIERALDPNQDGDLSDGVDVINLSLGGLGDPDSPLSKAVDNAVGAGTIVVVAAGNSGPIYQTINTPGNAREAITVGASDKSDALADFSSRGPVIWNGKVILKPDLVAPGVNICAAQADKWLPDKQCLDERHISISGTSMATPQVAGAAALLKQKNPDWTPYEIKSVLRNTAININSDLVSQGFGRIDILGAINSNKPPVARLEPISFEVKGKVDIIGTALAENFKEYSLFIGQGYSPQNFTQLYQSSQPVSNSILYSLDTWHFDEGINIIKLVVTDQAGNKNEDRIVIRINNFEISAIGETLNYIKESANVKGSLFLPKYLNLLRYQVEYFDKTENQWKSLCINSTRRSLNNEILCPIEIKDWPNGLYDFRIAISKDGFWKPDTDEPFRAAVVNELMTSWPIEFDSPPQDHHQVSNFGNKSEILAPNFEYTKCYRFGMSLQCITGDPTLIFIKSNGKSQKITKLSDGSKIDTSLPAIYFDKKLNQNLIAVLSLDADESTERIRIIDWNGRVKLSGKPIPFEVFPSPIIIVFSKDQKNEFYVTAFNSSTNERFIYGFGPDGKILPNFPIKIKKERKSLSESLISTQVIFLKYGNDYRLATIAGEYKWTNDGMNLYLYLDIYSLNGNLIKRVPIFDEPNKDIWFDLPFSVAGDLNNDGNSEIAIGYSTVDNELFFKDYLNPEAYKTYFVFLDGEGKVIGETPEIKGYTVNKLAIGNLGYQNPVVVVALEDTWPTTYNGQKLIALEATGQILFDKNLEDWNDLIQGLAIGDIDDDGKSEIVVNHRPRWYDGKPSALQIFNNKGELKNKILLPTLGAVDDYWGTQAILDDLDGDKKIDISLQSLFIPKDFSWLKTRIYVLNLNKNYHPERLDWPTFLHDNQHTAIYQEISPPEEASIKVLSPNGGEKWKRGKTYQIKWSAKKVKKVNIYLKDDSQSISCSECLPDKYCSPCGATLIASNIPAAQGKYPWRIPTSQSFGSKYKILIWDANQPVVAKGESENYFSIGEETVCGDRVCGQKLLHFLVSEEKTIDLNYGNYKIKTEKIYYDSNGYPTADISVNNQSQTVSQAKQYNVGGLDFYVFQISLYPESSSDGISSLIIFAGPENNINCPQDCGNICFDSDNGRNYYERGYTLKAPSEAFDCCFDPKKGGCVYGKSARVLSENYCLQNQIRNQKYNCPKGCLNGACLKSSLLMPDLKNLRNQLAASITNAISFLIEQLNLLLIKIKK